MESYFHLERVSEEKEARPDFKIARGGEDLYLEAKALGWASDGIQHNAAINDGIDAQISIEDQVTIPRQSRGPSFVSRSKRQGVANAAPSSWATLRWLVSARD